MRRDKFCPSFDLTEKQAVAFANYGPLDAIKATVAARILSGDPSSGEPTTHQLEFVRRLAEKMGVGVARLCRWR